MKSSNYEGRGHERTLHFGRLAETLLLAKEGGILNCIRATKARVHNRCVRILREGLMSQLERCNIQWPHSPTPQKSSITLARFDFIFETKFDQKITDNMYNEYTKRLYDYRRRHG